ncbi:MULTISPECIES: hypothetical protein [Agrobacterium]|uniref:hypothetical protein n=1 Tax=Agrobacterium tumefaciens TaxID=358 RepID=UPI001571ABB2|nr:hypothetical protein [Agrobacterium tumefaciens]
MNAPRGSEVWRDYVADGIPSSGFNHPKKADARAWAGWVETLVTSGVLSSGPWFATRAAMTLVYAANTIAIVYNDETASNNGLYIKTGASGSGSWTQLTSFLPGYQFVTASPTDASTANAIIASTSPRLPAGDGVALVTLAIPTTNITSPVTVSFDGGAALTIKTRTGEDPDAGEMQQNDVVAGFVSGATFRLISDLNSLRNFQSAKAWANNEEDAPLPASLGGDGATTFSAKHWAAKSKEDADRSDVEADRSEAARAGSESARDQAAGYVNDIVSEKEVPITATRNGMESIEFPAGMNSLETRGYAVMGDGGHAQYVRVAVEPSHGLRVRSVDRFVPNGTVDAVNGGWWEISEAVPSVQQAGSPHDGINSDTAGLAKIAALPRKDVVFKIPPGDTVLDQNIFVQDRSLSIEGDGSGVSRIRCTGEGGFKFLSTDTLETVSSAHRVNVRGVSIVCEEVHSAAGEGRTGFEAEWSYTGSGTIERIVLDDVVVRGGGPGKWWKKGVRLVDAAQVRASNLNIYNQDGHQASLAVAGLEIVRDKATNITGFELNNFRSSRTQNAILISQKDAWIGDGTVEGFTLTNGEAVNCAYAIREDVESGTGKYFDSISISNFHWNASRAGIKAGRVRGLRLALNHFFHQNFGDVTPAPLEAAINILLQLDGFSSIANAFTRYNTITTAAPCFLFPDAAALNWARIEGGQFANWRNLVESHGALTALRDKLFIGPATLISTPLLAGCGFRGNQTTIGGNDNKANGETITFPHRFVGAPIVSCWHRAANEPVVVKPYDITETGFKVYTNFTSGTIQVGWSATGS